MNTKHQRLPLNTRKLFCAVRMAEHSHRLPKESERVSLEIFRSHLDMALDTLVWVPLLELRLGQTDPEVLANLSCSGILGFSED